MEGGGEMKTVALIPARSGSKRVPNKNILPLGGIPLMAHSIVLARSLEGIDGVYVSTDSEQYGSIAKKWDAEVIWRSDEAAADNATDFDVLDHFRGKVDWDLCVYLRPTTPLRSARIVQEAIREMEVAQGSNITGLRSVHVMPESAFKSYVRADTGLIRPIVANQDPDIPNQWAVPTFKANGYVDIALASEISDGRLWGPSVIGYRTPVTHEIDTPEDFNYLEYLIQQRHYETEVQRDQN
jgi:CMP-N,N'-diacetyllegionaminic acid synthase